MAAGIRKGFRFGRFSLTDDEGWIPAQAGMTAPRTVLFRQTIERPCWQPWLRRHIS